MAKQQLEEWLVDHPAPAECGVYQFYDRHQIVVYVGKSVNLSKRIRQYLQATRSKKNRKTLAIVSSACRVDFEVCPSPKEALLRENELIRTLRPKFNTAGAFSFLYPVIGLRFEHRRLEIVRTTCPEFYPQFSLFGAFRDRQLTEQMTESFAFLLSIIAHREPATRLKTIPNAPYSRRLAFREVSEEFFEHTTAFFAGQNDSLLQSLFMQLLTHERALSMPHQIESHLKVLRSFFVKEAFALRTALDKVDPTKPYVEQSQRDALFIEVSDA